MTWREPAPLRCRAHCAIPKNNCAVLACIANKALLGARSYLVPDPIRTIMMCGRGGTGRRATLRSLWPKGRGSSSLLDRTMNIDLLGFLDIWYNWARIHRLPHPTLDFQPR